MSRDCTLNAFDPGGLGGGELSIFQVSVNFGEECKRQCRENAAVKL